MARILVVDDKQAMRVMLEARLSAKGHGVELAADLASAKAALDAAPIDVVITDLRMGRGGDGLDVVRAV
ncbi:MAG TPA: response regulator, partial [Myxococcales bacterium]|nr:response regulator [Myxococcales bacterium]